MATFAQIREVRLALDDPAGFIDILEVTVLPSVNDALPQTAYFLTSAGSYNGVQDGAFVVLRLRVADSRISEWVDSVGVAGAIQKGYVAIMQRLGNELLIVKNSDGAESTEFIKLSDLYAFYKDMAKTTIEQPPAATAGVYLKTKASCVAGGNL